jgi:hypothetical protein
MFFAALLLIMPVTLVDAQANLVSVLTGTWEGELQRGTGRDADPSGRTLVIKSAREEGGRWTVEATYGITGRRLDPITIAVEQGAELTLRFLTPANSDVRLVLGRAGDLVGTLRTPGGQSERWLKLEKTKQAQ